jgi:hypothetical protein
MMLFLELNKILHITVTLKGDDENAYFKKFKIICIFVHMKIPTLHLISFLSL